LTHTHTHTHNNLCINNRMEREKLFLLCEGWSCNSNISSMFKHNVTKPHKVSDSKILPRGQIACYSFVNTTGRGVFPALTGVQIHCSVQYLLILLTQLRLQNAEYKI